MYSLWNICDLKAYLMLPLAMTILRHATWLLCLHVISSQYIALLHWDNDNVSISYIKTVHYQKFSIYGVLIIKTISVIKMDWMVLFLCDCCNNCFIIWVNIKVTLQFKWLRYRNGYNYFLMTYRYLITLVMFPWIQSFLIYTCIS